MSDTSTNVFRRSSRCAEAGCVEIATAADGVLMRDSKISDSPIISFSGQSWQDFVAAAKDGLFD